MQHPAHGSLLGAPQTSRTAPGSIDIARRNNALGIRIGCLRGLRSLSQATAVAGKALCAITCPDAQARHSRLSRSTAVSAMPAPAEVRLPAFAAQTMTREMSGTRSAMHGCGLQAWKAAGNCVCCRVLHREELEAHLQCKHRLSTSCRQAAVSDHHLAVTAEQPARRMAAEPAASFSQLRPHGTIP